MGIVQAFRLKRGNRDRGKKQVPLSPTHAYFSFKNKNLSLFWQVWIELEIRKIKKNETSNSELQNSIQQGERKRWFSSIRLLLDYRTPESNKSPRRNRMKFNTRKNVCQLLSTNCLTQNGFWPSGVNSKFRQTRKIPLKPIYSDLETL